ncbi:MAG: maleylacetoacetate isomerase [Alphaproteobacteria bacterium]|nr:MAG: maleylacetoacetate isomerase [Alphaproteobacteria bacterium]
MTVVLYDYWRSSAAYRVRIALNLLGMEYRSVQVDLQAGAQQGAAHLARNPQGFVPLLEIDRLRLTQSLAIIEYLDETRAAGFLPEDPPGRARVRAIAHAIAMDIHPVLNLSVARRAVEIAQGRIGMKDWMHAFMPARLQAVEALLDHPDTGMFCHGDRVSLADICLVPQVYNARRWEVDLSPMPRIAAIAAGLEALEPVAAAHPDRIGPPAG